MSRSVALIVAALCAASCAGILGLRGPMRRPFEHRGHVVQGVGCLACHNGVERSGDDSPLHLPDEQRCRECHTTPHDQRPCLGCHGSQFGAIELQQARDHLRFAHDVHVAAVDGNCMRCHDGIARPNAERLRPTLATCIGCHEHRDRFAMRDCQSCHTNLARELRPPPSHMVHGDDFLPRHAAAAVAAEELCASCHRDRFCASCHGATVPALPESIGFDDPFAAGMHRAGFRARHAEASRAEPGLCITCHTEQSCRDCHSEREVSAPVGVSRQSPHPAGWVGIGPGQNQHGPAARRDPVACASCHGGAGEMLCVDCHRVGGVGGSPHPPGWSSRKDMREVPCRACHVGVP